MLGTFLEKLIILLHYTYDFKWSILKFNKPKFNRGQFMFQQLQLQLKL